MPFDYPDEKQDELPPPRSTSPAPNEDVGNAEEEVPAPLTIPLAATELLKIPIVPEAATAKDYKYESFSPYSPRKNLAKPGSLESSSSEEEEEEDLELVKQERNRRNSE